MTDVPVDRFETFVVEAIDSLPEELALLIDNVVVTIDESRRSDLLGLYEGLPLTEREGYGLGGGLPDRIRIFRRAICSSCRTEDEVREQVRVTVVHEIAHHFGISDERLDELGWA